MCARRFVKVAAWSAAQRELRPGLLLLTLIDRGSSRGVTRKVSPVRQVISIVSLSAFGECDGSSLGELRRHVSTSSSLTSETDQRVLVRHSGAGLDDHSIRAAHASPVSPGHRVS